MSINFNDMDVHTQRLEEAQGTGVPYTPPRSWTPAGTPAWLSIPKPVRFAVWVWAIWVIVSIGVVVGALSVLVTGLQLGMLFGDN